MLFYHSNHDNANKISKGTPCTSRECLNLFRTQSKAHGKTNTDTVFTFTVIRLKIVIVHIEIQICN